MRTRCPLDCLELSPHVHRPLIRALSRRPGAGRPVTVGDVLKLARTGGLDEIEGIGPSRAAEIENALHTAGFQIHHDHTPPAR